MAVEVVVRSRRWGAGRVAWLACDAPLAVIPASLHHTSLATARLMGTVWLAVDFGDDAFTGLGVAPFGFGR